MKYTILVFVMTFVTVWSLKTEEYNPHKNLRLQDQYPPKPQGQDMKPIFPKDQSIPPKMPAQTPSHDPMPDKPHKQKCHKNAHGHGQKNQQLSHEGRGHRYHDDDFQFDIDITDIVICVFAIIGLVFVIKKMVKCCRRRAQNNRRPASQPQRGRHQPQRPAPPQQIYSFGSHGHPVTYMRNQPTHPQPHQPHQQHQPQPQSHQSHQPHHSQAQYHQNPYYEPTVHYEHEAQVERRPPPPPPAPMRYQPMGLVGHAINRRRKSKKQQEYMNLNDESSSMSQIEMQCKHQVRRDMHRGRRLSPQPSYPSLE